MPNVQSFDDLIVDAPLEEPHRYEGAEIQSIIKDLVRRGRNVGTVMITRAGARRGARTRWIAPRSTVSTLSPWRVPVHGNRGDASVVGARICEDKALTKEVLSAAGVQTPRARKTSSVEDAKAFATEIGSPVVIKPRYGTQGKGISVNLTTDEEIDEAFALLASPRYSLVEEFVRPVCEYRVLASDHECFSVVRRIPPYVRGDGKSTIRQLIKAKNAHRLTVPSTADTAIPMDSATERFLKEGDLTLDSILPNGVAVGVRGVGGVSGGAEPQECFDDVDPLVKSTAVSAVAAIPGLNWAGVDVIIDENGMPQVIEVNSSADISSSAYPFFGVPRDLGGLIWNRLVRRDAVSRSLPTITSIPAPSPDPKLASSFGIKRRTRVSKLISQKLREQGKDITILAPELFSYSSSGRKVWFSGTGTLNDLVGSHAFASIHGIVLRLASVRNVPTVPFKTVSTINELRALIDDPEVDNPQLITPYKSSWQRGVSDPDQFIRKWEKFGESSRSLLVQEELSGTRVNVAATSTGVLMVSGGNQATDEQILAACEVAKSTVRMIPQLNLAFVEVVLPDDSALGTALLEGIVRRPSLSPNDFILAGSVDGLLEFLIALGEAELPPYSQGETLIRQAEREARSPVRRARQVTRLAIRQARRALDRAKGRD